jgi:integrase/recombinase XerD
MQDNDELDLAELMAADVVAFVVDRCPAQSRGAAKMTVTALRSLLGFLHLRGIVSAPLAEAVPSTASWRLSGLPRALEPEQLQALLACCDRTTANGRRDYAVLVLLARLGLRRGEVAALRLEDVDWRAGELRIAGKGRRAERLPLPGDVGEAIVAYLRDGRPATALDRSLIVRVRAPHHGLTGGGSRRSCSPQPFARGWARCIRIGCATRPPRRCCAPARALRRSGRCCATARS